MKLPRTEQNRAFEDIRKRGIYKENVRRLQANNMNLICERSQGQDSKRVICTGCKGFYSKRRINRHKKLFCTRRASETPRTIDLKKVPSVEVPHHFQENVLNHFRGDEVGTLCIKDPTILRIGMSLWAKNPKQTERKGVMAEMRRLGRLLKEMKVLSDDATLIGENIFEREHFKHLKEAISSLTTTESGEMKYGERVSIGYTLIKGKKDICIPRSSCNH